MRSIFILVLEIAYLWTCINASSSLEIKMVDALPVMKAGETTNVRLLASRTADTPQGDIAVTVHEHLRPYQLVFQRFIYDKPSNKTTLIGGPVVVPFKPMRVYRSIVYEAQFYLLSRNKVTVLEHNQPSVSFRIKFTLPKRMPHGEYFVGFGRVKGQLKSYSDVFETTILDAKAPEPGMQAPTAALGIFSGICEVELNTAQNILVTGIHAMYVPLVAFAYVKALKNQHKAWEAMKHHSLTLNWPSAWVAYRNYRSYRQIIKDAERFLGPRNVRSSDGEELMDALKVAARERKRPRRVFEMLETNYGMNSTEAIEFILRFPQYQKEMEVTGEEAGNAEEELLKNQ